MILFYGLVSLCCVFVSSTSATTPKQFFVDTLNITGSWTHYWEECVGSGHAALGLRADYQEQMTRIHQDLGFKQVRFHGLFVDDMSVVLPAEQGIDEEEKENDFSFLQGTLLINT